MPSATGFFYKLVRRRQNLNRMGTERCTVQRQRRPYDVAIFVAVVLAAELTIFVLPSAGRMILVLLLASLYFPGLALAVPRFSRDRAVPRHLFGDTARRFWRNPPRLPRVPLPVDRLGLSL